MAGGPLPPAATDVADPDHPGLAGYRRLNDVAFRRRFEQDAGLFVAEGTTVIRRLLESRYPVLSVLATRRVAPAVSEPLLRRPAADLFVVEQDVLDAVVGFPAHRGGFALGRRVRLPHPEAIVSGARAVMVVEDVNDHENLGALFRNAAALGVGGALLSTRCADPLYRRSVRVSMGGVLHVPYGVLDPWPAGLHALRTMGLTLVALTPSADAEAVGAVAARLRGPVAVMVGSEGPGLSPEAMAAAEVRARIPMVAGADSLNVATAAAVAFHRLVTAG